MSMVFSTLMRMIQQDGHQLLVGRKSAVVFRKCSCADFLQILVYDMQIKVALVMYYSNGCSCVFRKFLRITDMSFCNNCLYT